MTTKTKVIICVVALAGSAALGRYSLPAKIITETKIVEVVKVVKDTHKETTTTTNPDGSTTTKIVEDTKTDRTKNETADNKTETIYNTSKLHLAALAGIPISLSGPVTPLYGVSISKDLIGPVSLGIWGLTSGVAGISVGLSL